MKKSDNNPCVLNNQDQDLKSIWANHDTDSPIKRDDPLFGDFAGDQD
jgi:hypothetical protein